MTTIPYIFCFLLAASGASFLFFSRKTQRNNQQKIIELQKKIQTALRDDTARKPARAFAAKLSDASMTTKLQQPRMQLQSGTAGSPPEKYKFFSNLVAKGMNAEEIAEVLGISPTEASQLVQLCGVSGCRN